MTRSRLPDWPRLLEVGLLALVAAGLALLASNWLPFRLQEARVYDFLSTLAPPEAAELGAGPGGIVIVAIDEPSFAELGLQWPWPRSLHAELVEALRAAGARVIGLDLVFAEPSLPQEDAALAAALGPDVVLAADESLLETPQVTQIVRTEPMPQLLRNGAAVGLASVALDEDNVLRRLPAWTDSFAAKVVAAAGSGEGQEETAAQVYLQAIGPARSYPTVSYYQALDPETFLPPGFFEDKVVLVGLSLQTAAEARSGAADSFATSFTARTGQLVPGVEVQATIVDNLRFGLWVDRLPPAAGFASILCAALLAGLLALRPSDSWTLLGGFGLGLCILAVSYGLLEGFRIFLSPLAPALAAGLVLAPMAVRDTARERRARREITRAFAQYLAPALVERLARDPSALRLGGERRVLTILFCDVRNFTPLAERLKDEPERLTQLINRLLTPLSQAILAHSGTIDKYIGDCVMAFWNAPLDDPEHAVHAVEAALAMLAAVDRLNAELEAENGAGQVAPTLSVGIGVNTGPCVVGNMGSSLRFDYSALGDPVNYAARLEGASKSYGVPLLIGGTTAEAIAGQFDAFLVDRLGVKGRSGVAPVYTVLPGGRNEPEVQRRHQQLVERFIAGDVQPGDAEAAFLAGLQPGLAPIYRSFGQRTRRP